MKFQINDKVIYGAFALLLVVASSAKVPARANNQIKHDGIRAFAALCPDATSQANYDHGALHLFVESQNEGDSGFEILSTPPTHGRPIPRTPNLRPLPPGEVSFLVSGLTPGSSFQGSVVSNTLCALSRFDLMPDSNGIVRVTIPRITRPCQGQFVADVGFNLNPRGNASATAVISHFTYNTVPIPLDLTVDNNTGFGEFCTPIPDPTCCD